MGPVACDAREYNQRAGNANIVVFRKGKWPYDPSVIAITSVMFNTETGEIYDADMEINDGSELPAGEITVGDSEIIYDLQSVITHEAGHFYGLAHTRVGGATIKKYYDPGEVKKRSLEDDDIAGICDIYGSTRPYLACDPTPRHGFQSTCGQPPRTQKACGSSSIVPGHAEPKSSASLALVVLGTASMFLRRSYRS